ncbi:galectin-3b [Engraulis encrasicolus]|uniref:galectin-3b n=1 Tax=Engraulis encrasicolus TaxID=184585 RepID=UPI002FD379D4
MDLSDALGGNPTQAGAPVWPGQPNQPNQPAWPGQPASNPTWPGQPSQPAWPGQPSQPAWPGQPSQPSWPGQPGQPSQPSQPSQPGWPSPAPPTAPQVAPQRSLTVPYDHNLGPRGIYDRMLITIMGQIKPNAKAFTIDLSKGRDIALHLNPRFNEDGHKVVVRNTLIGGTWGSEERNCPGFPFVAGQPFELKILCHHDQFKVAVNKAHLFEFKHRIRELNMITGMGIYGDVTLTAVNIDTLH